MGRVRNIFALQRFFCVLGFGWFSTANCSLLRRLGRAAATVTATTSVFVSLNANLPAQASQAPQSDVVAEQIRQAAAILPGLGKPDVYYPSIYEGTWNVNQEITGIVDRPVDSPSQERGISSRPRFVRDLDLAFALKRPIPEYKRVYSAYADNIILDRGISTSNLLNALDASVTNIAAFSPSNPNLVEIKTTAGDQVELRVTKRSVEDMSQVVNGKTLQDASAQAGVAVSFSEFERVIETSNKDEPPREWAVRLLVRMKATDENTIQGLERLYVYDQASPDQSPVEIIKSRITLRRGSE